MRLVNHLAFDMLLRDLREEQRESGFDRKPCLTESLFRRVIEVMLQLEADFSATMLLCGELSNQVQSY